MSNCYLYANEGDLVTHCSLGQERGQGGEKRDLQNFVRFSLQDQKLENQHVFVATPEPFPSDLEDHRKSLTLQLLDRE